MKKIISSAIRQIQEIMSFKTVKRRENDEVNFGDRDQPSATDLPGR